MMDLFTLAKDLFYQNISLVEKCKDDNEILYLPKIKNVPQEIKDIRQQMIEKYHLFNMYNNPELDDFIFQAEPGKHLSLHSDKLSNLDKSQYDHLRANWVVQVPDNDTYIFGNGGNLYKIELNEFYLIDALESHGITKVLGNTPLLLYSFGFLKKKGENV